MGIANYTNLSELMNELLKTGRSISISDLVEAAARKKIVLASEGELADQGDLENGFIALVDAMHHAGTLQPCPANETESHLIQLYESGNLAENGYGGKEGDQFLTIKWIALTNNLPVISNLRQ